MKDINDELLDRMRGIGRLMRMKCPPEKIAEKDGIQEINFAAMRREAILIMLYDEGKGIHQHELAERMHVRPSTLSEMINKLEAEGYVTRTTDPADRRATIISATRVGEERADTLDKMRIKTFAGIFKNLNDEEKRQLVDLLDKILKTI